MTTARAGCINNKEGKLGKKKKEKNNYAQKETRELAVRAFYF